MTVLYRDTDPTEAIGYVSHGGCENHHCLAAIAEGRPWHATPAGFAVALPDYHFATEAEAAAAIAAVMADQEGRFVRPEATTTP